MIINLDIPVITIDGGAATGKGTIRAKLAHILGFHSLDSGNLYRAVGLLCFRKQVECIESMAEVASTLRIETNGDRVILHGQDETEELKSQHCGELASKVAKIPEVRKALLNFQLSKRQWPGLVTDGRDQGFIFEDAHRYFFTIDPGVAAVRRLTQLLEMKQIAEYEVILAEIIKRNTEDRERKVDPLKPHEHAFIIDTGGKKVDEIVDLILSHVRIGK